MAKFIEVTALNLTTKYYISTTQIIKVESINNGENCKLYPAVGEPFDVQESYDSIKRLLL